MTISVSKEVPPGIVLRKADAAECLAAGLSPEVALRASMGASDEYFAVSVDDELVGVWGYSARSFISLQCQAWLLTTPAIEKHKVRFARSSVRVVKYLLERFDEIEVLVHRDYDAAIGWLIWLDFVEAAKVGAFLTMVTHRRDNRWVS